MDKRPRLYIEVWALKHYIYIYRGLLTPQELSYRVLTVGAVG